LNYYNLFLVLISSTGRP